MALTRYVTNDDIGCRRRSAARRAVLSLAYRREMRYSAKVIANEKYSRTREIGRDDRRCRPGAFFAQQKLINVYSV